MTMCKLWCDDNYIRCLEFNRIPIKGELIELPGELYVVLNVKYVFNRIGDGISTIIYVKRHKKQGNSMFL